MYIYPKACEHEDLQVQSCVDPNQGRVGGWIENGSSPP